MSASMLFVYIDRYKPKIFIQKDVELKFMFTLFKSDEPKFNYGGSELVLYKIFKMHNKFFVGGKL